MPTTVPELEDELDELDVRPVDDDDDEEEDDEDELDGFPVDELDDELLELDGVGSTTPPQAKSKALVASTPVSLIARLACDSDLILSIVLTLLVLVLTRW